MFSLFNWLIFFFWLTSALIDFLLYTYLWQLKEYRWDRFKDFLSTVEGKFFFTRYAILWRSLFAIILFFWPINDVLTIKFILVILFGIDIGNGFYQLLKHQLRRPNLTVKAIVIIVFSLIFEGGLFLLKGGWDALAILLVMRFITVTLIVGFVNFPSEFIKKFIISRATLKMKKYPKLKVIGITGSYGKTSVKNFLSHILSSKFRVIKTPRNINTEIGIAKFILKNNFNDFDVFVCEMGAYTEGEIKAICNIVEPEVGVLTAINEQHLSLFGDIRITQKAKYELLRALPENGLAVVNSDNEYCREFIGDLKTQVQTFGLEETFKPTFLIKNVKTTEKGIYCTGVIANEEGSVEIPIVGEHNFMNIAPCFLVGMYLGMKREEVREACKTLQMPDGVMQIKHYGQATIIDDSYNSNPDGFKAALQVLQKFPSVKRRIVITRGMLELGSETQELHEIIGEEISLVADELIIITRDSEEALTAGVGNRYKTEVKLIYNQEELLAYFKTLKDKSCVVLLENRMPLNIKNELATQ